MVLFVWPRHDLGGYGQVVDLLEIVPFVNTFVFSRPRLRERKREREGEPDACSRGGGFLLRRVVIRVCAGVPDDDPGARIAAVGVVRYFDISTRNILWGIFCVF